MDIIPIDVTDARYPPFEGCMLQLRLS